MVISCGSPGVQIGGSERLKLPRVHDGVCRRVPSGLAFALVAAGADLIGRGPFEFPESGVVGGGVGVWDRPFGAAVPAGPRCLPCEFRVLAEPTAHLAAVRCGYRCAVEAKCSRARVAAARGRLTGAPRRASTRRRGRVGMLLELEDIERARARIGGRVHATPVMSSATVGEELGVRLYLKAELFQKTGSFKPRGVFSKLLSMDPAVRSRGLVSLSAGDHAAALAYGAPAVGARATIVMAAAAMRSKGEAARRYRRGVVASAGRPAHGSP